MKNSVSIDDITNGLLRSRKVKQLYSKDHRAFRDGSGQSVLPDKLSLMREIITSISGSCRSRQGRHLQRRIRAGDPFQQCLQELKRHVGA